MLKDWSPSHKASVTEGSQKLEDGRRTSIAKASGG